MHTGPTMLYPMTFSPEISGWTTARSAPASPPEKGRTRSPPAASWLFSPAGALAALGPPPAKGGDRPLLIDGVRLADATAFSFSPDGREIALFSTGKQPGESAGELYRIPRSGGAPRAVASRVTEWRWSTG